MWFLTWRIKNFVWKVWNSLLENIILLLLIDLANKLYVVEKLLISFYAISY